MPSVGNLVTSAIAARVQEHLPTGEQPFIDMRAYLTASHGFQIGQVHYPASLEMLLKSPEARASREMNVWR